MHCEIEFLPVGEKSRAGDAIVIRYGEEHAFKIMLVDGGTAATGDEIVSHLKSYYGDNVEIADVVLTHSDADHASGLRNVLRDIPVHRIWMHVPWHFAEDSKPYFKNKQWTTDGLTEAIKDSYDIISEIVDLAEERSTEIFYPFEGSQIGPFTVMSPQKHCYVRLLPQFGPTPEPDQELLEQEGWWLGKAPVGILKAVIEAAIAKVSKWVAENWGLELLRDGGVTSASNESSVVLYGATEEKRYLLTGDAGVNALTWAATYADERGFPLQDFSFVQIPHHGSRRNVGPTILDRLLGPIQPAGTKRFTAFVSVPKDDETHPRKIVKNAFIRRGGIVIATAGNRKCFYGGFLPRAGYEPVYGEAISTQVEDYD